MKIAVIGSGYVGTTTATLLAFAGHDVRAIDVNQEKVDTINSGRAFFFENGLDGLIAHTLQSGKLQATSSYDWVADADVIFSCVGTPDNPDGSANMSYVDTVAKLVGEQAKDGAIFAQKSTVPVGTGARLMPLMPRLSYVSNPEFLSEGTAIHNSLIYDRIVVGGDDLDAAQRVAELFQGIDDHALEINRVSGINADQTKIEQNAGEIIMTSINSAELMKVTANAFLALKISFANNVAKLADKSGADVTEVMNGVGSDRRIGRAFFNAGRGYGGGCFPKDVSGLITEAIKYGVDFNIMNAAVELNESMPGYIINKVTETMQLKDTRVAVLGLSFKAGTDDCRKSPAIKIANMLAKLGAQVTAYDPKANHEAKPELHSSITVADDIGTALKDAKAVFIATDWPEFKSLAPDELAKRMSGKLVIDCMNCMDKTALEKAGLTYMGVGR